MRILVIAAAAAAAVFAVPASAATSAPTAPMGGVSAAAVVAGALAGNGQVRVVVEERRGYQHRRHGRRAHWRKTCRSYWHHGRRVRNCRRVRYWR